MESENDFENCALSSEPYLQHKPGIMVKHINENRVQVQMREKKNSGFISIVYSDIKQAHEYKKRVH